MKVDENHIDKSILRKYEIISRIGKGAYGIVWKVKSKRTGKLVCLKRIFNAFQNPTDSQRTYREVMLLQHLRHENIIRLLNVYRAENDIDIYLVFNLMETDLSHVIRANILEPIHKKYIIYQLVKTLKYLHSGQLVHRDIKPANLLLNSECHMTLCDFGLARTIDSIEDDSQNILTDYIATRWYRSPLVLLGSHSYGYGIDMWAVGCIIGEILSGKPLFRGSSTMNQLQKIITVIGKPPPEKMKNIKSEYAQSMLDSIPNGQLRSLKEMFPNVDPAAVDLMEKLLTFLPDDRLSAEQALKHPYLKEFAGSSKESVMNPDVNLYFNDNKKYTVSQYRDKLYEAIKKQREKRRKVPSRGSSQTNRRTRKPSTRTGTRSKGF